MDTTPHLSSCFQALQCRVACLQGLGWDWGWGVGLLGTGHCWDCLVSAISPVCTQNTCASPGPKSHHHCFTLKPKIFPFSILDM